MIRMLAERFRPDAVNLLAAHTHLDGAVIAGSERTVHLGENWAATPQAIPPAAHYVALGHIHRPQRIEAAPAPTHYAGSPLQLDFGEEGERKSFVVAEARPGRPAAVELIPYEGGLELRSVRATFDELEQQVETLRTAGWLRVKVPLASPDPNLNSKVRRLLPNAVSVDVDLPERDPDAPEISTRGLPPSALYAAYHEKTHGAPPQEPLLEAFERLRDEVEKGGEPG
jgi:exonuclease SbcD